MNLWIILLFIFSGILFVRCNRTNRNLNLQQLQNRCLSYQSTAVKSSTCITQKKLKMQVTKGVENGVFYCLTYEKTTGNVYGFDSLTIELHPDYDLQYSGANVIDYEFPSFKLYDVRVTEEYKGRFAIYSNNTSFKIYQVTINNEPQNCTFGKGKNRHMWPEQRLQIDVDELSTDVSLTKTPTISSPSPTDIETTIGPRTHIELTTIMTSSANNMKFTMFTPQAFTTEFPHSTEIQRELDSTTESVLYTSTSNTDEENNDMCGKSSSIFDLKRYQIPYNPGEFPFAVSIFHIIKINEHFYKCAGNIISNTLVITSVNCILDHNSKLINEEKVLVYTAQYYLLSKELNKNTKVYNVNKIFTHENFNYYLENNIAALKVQRSIEFDDFTQPACLPELNTRIKDSDVLKLVGYGKSNFLTENDFYVHLNDACGETLNACETFAASSVTTNYTDLGCGLYILDERGRWKLIGITSIIPHYLDTNRNITFTNLSYFSDWLKIIL